MQIFIKQSCYITIRQRKTKDRSIVSAEKIVYDDKEIANLWTIKILNYCASNDRALIYVKYWHS
jgi:hypothetical protein